jgi:YegS/Rv2252/BmrU family lipid kinase
MAYKTLIIVNPSSNFYQLLHFLKELSFSYEVVYSKGPKHPYFLAKENAKEYDTFIAVGGDGTVNEVGSGILDSGEDKILGIIPAGRENNIARSLGIPFNYEEACRRLLGENVIRIDVGKVNDKYFFGNAGVGFTAEIVKYYNHIRFLKRVVPNPVDFSIWIAFISYRVDKMKVDIDGRTIEDKFFDITISNGKYIGNGDIIAPYADMQDGLLDIILFGDLSKLEVAKNRDMLKKGAHLQHPKVKMERGKKIKINSECNYHVDGDLAGRGEVVFEIKEKILSVKV